MTIFEAAGGEAGILRLAEAWHRRVLADEVVSHAFSHGFRPDHTERLAAYWTEALGGPAWYSGAMGDETAVLRLHAGNGEHAEMDAELLAKLDTLNIPVITVPILSVNGKGGVVKGVELEGGVALDCERIFFSIAQYPADDLGAQLGCARDEHGQIVIDDKNHTSVLNVFAAGDITPGPQLAISAAAGGAVSALAIHKSLVPDERKLS